MRANRPPAIFFYDSVSAEEWKHSHNLLGKKELERLTSHCMNDG